MLPPNLRTRHARGFTLLELLVAILVVLVLAALLFPALNGFTEAGDRAACAGNLRQIGAAFNLLLTENGGAYPAYASNPDPGDAGVWYDKLRPYLGINTAKGVDVTQPKVYKCPSNRSHGWNFNKLSYGYNIFLGNNAGTSPFQRVRRIAITHPSTVIVCADGDNREATYDTQLDARWRGPGVLHKGGANILYADGHVEWHLRDKTVFSDSGWTDDLMRAYGAYGRYAY